MKSSEEIKNLMKQLEKELEEAKKQEIPQPLPSPLPSPYFNPLIKMCESHIASIAEKGYADEDDKHYIFECALESIYGKNVWSWYNKNNNR